MGVPVGSAAPPGLSIRVRPVLGTPPAPLSVVSLHEEKEAAERAAILAAIQSASGSVTDAAAALGVSKRHLFRRLAALGLNEEARAIRESAGRPGVGRPPNT